MQIITGSLSILSDLSAMNALTTRLFYTRLFVLFGIFVSFIGRRLSPAFVWFLVVCHRCIGFVCFQYLRIFRSIGHNGFLGSVAFPFV